MKTTKTITYDPSVYKLVPKKPDLEIQEAFNQHFDRCLGLPELLILWRESLDAVSDTLPDVEEHSSGDIMVSMAIKDTSPPPGQWVLGRYKSDDKWELMKICKRGCCVDGEIAQMILPLEWMVIVSASTIVKAALEAAAKIVQDGFMQYKQPGTVYDSILTLDPQQILDSVK